MKDLEQQQGQLEICEKALAGATDQGQDCGGPGWHSLVHMLEWLCLAQSAGCFCASI